MKSRFFKLSSLAVITVVGAVIGGSVAFAQKNINEAFLMALYDGDLAAVKQAVAQGADVNEKRFSPLIVAAERDHLEIAKFLVRSGADVNGIAINGGSGSTPVRAAALSEKYRMVDYLLSVGADPVVGGMNDPLSPLMAGVMTGHLDQVKRVVGRGNVDLEYKEISHTPGSQEGKTALIIAAERGFVPIVKYLVGRGANVNNSHRCGRTALFYAAAGGRTQAVKLLIENGAEVNPKRTKQMEKCNEYPAPIINAKGIEVFRLLLEAGADPNVQPNSGQYWMRPINRAVEMCDAALIDLLLKHGAEYEAELKQTYEAKCR